VVVAGGVGAGVGLGVGEGVGAGVGLGVGEGVGAGVGLGVGEGVGDGVVDGGGVVVAGGGVVVSGGGVASPSGVHSLTVTKSYPASVANWWKLTEASPGEAMSHSQRVLISYDPAPSVMRPHVLVSTEEPEGVH
jgi:hypothetical protein